MPKTKPDSWNYKVVGNPHSDQPTQVGPYYTGEALSRRMRESIEAKAVESGLMSEADLSQLREIHRAEKKHNAPLAEQSQAADNSHTKQPTQVGPYYIGDILLPDMRKTIEKIAVSDGSISDSDLAELQKIQEAEKKYNESRIGRI